jgi:hypothetical protein
MAQHGAFFGETGSAASTGQYAQVTSCDMVSAPTGRRPAARYAAGFSAIDPTFAVDISAALKPSVIGIAVGVVAGERQTQPGPPSVPIGRSRDLS